MACSLNRVTAAVTMPILSALPFPVAYFFRTDGPTTANGRPVRHRPRVTAHHSPASSCQYDPCDAA